MEAKEIVPYDVLHEMLPIMLPPQRKFLGWLKVNPTKVHQALFDARQFGSVGTVRTDKAGKEFSIYLSTEGGWSNSKRVRRLGGPDSDHRFPTDTRSSKMEKLGNDDSALPDNHPPHTDELQVRSKCRQSGKACFQKNLKSS